MKKKFTFLIAALMLLTMINLPGKAVGQTRDNVTLEYKGSTTFNMSENTNYASSLELDGSNWSVYGAQNDASYMPACNKNGTIRLYPGSTNGSSITVTNLSGYTITSISFNMAQNTPTVKVGGTTISPTNNEYSINSTSFIVINGINATSGNQVQINSITINYTTSGGGGGSVTAPTLTDGCAFTGTQTVTITPASGTTVYYTTDGSTPDNTKTLYSVPFDVNATTTVKAIAYDGDNNTSSVVEATYIKYGNISAITAAGDYAVTGTVVAKNGNGLVIGDGTGYVYYHNGYSAPSYNIDANINIVGKIVENGSSAPKLWRFETGTSTITTASSSSYNPATATPIALDELTSTQTTGTHLSEYYSFTGTLIKTSASQYIVEIGNYSQIQLYGPSSTTNPSTTTLNGLENKKVNVTGYFTGKPSSWYSIMAETIEENTDPDTYEWVPVALSDLTSSDVFVIVGNNSNDYAMSNDKGTSAKPVATGVTVSDNKITSYVPMNLRWNISGNATDGYIFYPAGSTTTWMYCNGSPDIRVGTTNTNSYHLFKIKDNYLFNVGRSGYLGIYNSQDWRHYTSINSNIEGQTFTFYKRQLKTTDPTVSASPSTIDDFSYTYGGGPSIKSFTVGGTNLGSNDITIDLTKHTAFQLSLTEDAETWYNSLTLSPTAGTVANTPVYVRMNTGLAEGNYSDNITVSATGATAASVSLNGTVNPVPVTYTYILANTIEVGKHYLITSGKTGSVYVMGHQKTNNRNGVSVTVGDNGKISVTSDVINTENNVYEFVISGYGADHWTIYDETDPGYLYAASSGNNYLRTQGTNDANGIWSVTIDSDTKVASIVAQGSNSRKVMQFNSNLFACYSASSYDDVYLFVKEENNCDIYSATNIDSDMTIAGDMNIHAGVVTVEEGKKLTIAGTLTNTVAANLIIEEGGQLVHNNAGVYATVEKHIDAATDWDDATSGWNFIATPMTSLTISNTAHTNLIGTTAGVEYDLYAFDQSAQKEWINYKKDGNFTTLENGTGYLYARNADIDVQFMGVLDNSNGQIDLVYDETNAPAGKLGWNLVGNPFPCNATTDLSAYVVDGRTIKAITNGKGIAPCCGVMVKATAATRKVNFTKAPAAELSAPKNAAIEMVLTQTVTTRGGSNAETLDNAIVSFNEGSELGKFYFGNQNANIYIPQGNEEYAIVSAEAHGVMPVNFKANQNGQYTITVNTEDVEMGYLHLVDNMTGADIDLLNTPSYTFNARTDDYTSRFKLVFSANGMNNENGNDDFAFLSNGQLIIANDGEATLQVIDITGRVLSSEVINGSCSKNIDAATGVYVLRLVNGSNVKTQKVIIK